MANTKSAAKHARTSLVRRNRNHSVKSEIKTRRKHFNNALEKHDEALARDEFQKLSSRLDSAAKRGIIHKNVANRSKSRIAKALGKILIKSAD